MARKKSSKRDVITQLMANIENSMTNLYGASFEEVLRLKKVRQAIEAGEEFTFDSDPVAARQLEGILHTLATQTQLLIKQGDITAWEAGQKDADTTLGAIFGKTDDGKRTLEELTMRAREQARADGATANNFYHRQEGGINISERVWNVTEQGKRDLELLIQNGVKQGKTAEEISRDVRPFLHNPNAHFRRVRNKKTGELELSKAAKEYHCGTGVYRSAYKNAMRLARTEVNMAYRRAQWESYLHDPLVTGIRIWLSNNHTTLNSNGEVVPLTDICDELRGDYPKTFQWTGWHPQCRCRMTPITITPTDFKSRMKALMSGALNDWKPETTVTAPPAAFSSWVNDNIERLQKGASMPYYIRDNFIGGNPANKMIPAITQLEAEVQRQKVDKTKLEMQKRSLERMEKTANFYELDMSVAKELLEAQDSVHLGEELRRLIKQQGDALNEWVTFVEDQHERLATFVTDDIKKIFEKEAREKVAEFVERIQNAPIEFNGSYLQAMTEYGKQAGQLIQTIKQEQERLIKEAATMQYGKNVLAIMSGIKDVDTSAMENAIAAKDYAAIEAEAKKLKAIGKQIYALSNIDNPMHVAKIYSMAEALSVDKAVADQIQKWKDEYANKSYLQKQYATLNEYLQHKCEWQIAEYYESGNYDAQAKKYATWSIAEQGYKKKLKSLQDEIAWDILEKEVEPLSELTEFYINTKSPVYKHAYEVLNECVIDHKDLTKAQSMLASVKAKKSQLEALKAYRKSKKGNGTAKAVSFSVDAYTQERKDNAKYYIHPQDACDYLHKTEVDYWKVATDDEKEALWGYTGGSAYITETLRAIDGWHYRPKTYKSYIDAEYIKKHIDDMTNALDKCDLPDDIWIKRDDASWQVEYAFNLPTGGLAKYRNNPSLLVGKTGHDDSFWSCGACKNTKFTATGKKDVIYNIYCPKGTKGLYVQAFSTCGTFSKSWNGNDKPRNLMDFNGENEVILQRGLEYRITKAEYDFAKDMWYIDIEILSQEPKQFEIKSSLGYYCSFK